MSATTHLNQETNILPVKEHTEMLTNQFLLSMHKQDHPNHHLLTEPIQPRKIKSSIIDKQPNVHRYLRDGERLKKIHEDAHAVCRNKYPVNKVLNTRPPAINVKEEKGLPRMTRSKLAQLRSGYSPFLQSYLARIDSRIDPKCTDCNLEDHTTVHVFNCPTKPTRLTPTNLWTKPKKCAEFLGILSEESSS